MGLNSIPAFDRMERQVRRAGKIMLYILAIGGLASLVLYILF